MRKIGVVDLGFGDSGKGITTSLLCSERLHLIQQGKLIVVRANGGHQAGHTVNHNGKQHIFSQYGSGSLQRVPTFLTKNFTVRPSALLNEHDTLRDKVSVMPTLYIDPMAMLVTPLDVKEGQHSADMTGHGSVGVGFGTTIQRNESHYRLHFQDIYFPKVLRAKLWNICIEYFHSSWSFELHQFLEDCERLASMKNIKLKNYQEIYLEFDTGIFESAQGVLLDQEFGFFPNVTRSYTTSRNMVEIDGIFMNEIYYVTRTYQTRHGNGFMTNEELPEPVLKNAETETNQDGGYQGKFRRTQIDLDLLKYSLTCDLNYSGSLTKKHLVVTCFDQLPIDLKNLVEELSSVGIVFDSVHTSHSPDAKDMQLRKSKIDITRK